MNKLNFEYLKEKASKKRLYLEDTRPVSPLEPFLLRKHKGEEGMVYKRSATLEEVDFYIDEYLPVECLNHEWERKVEEFINKHGGI